MSVLTRITNNIGTRRLPYIPPNGATLSTGQTIDVPGLLDTELYLADLLRLDEFRTDVALGRITVTYVIVQTAPENGRLSPYDKDLTPIATLGNYATTGLAITESPTDDSYVCLMVNGVMESLGNGARNRSFYFSNDGGTTARLFSAVKAGDTLYFNGTIAGYDLSATDRVSMVYDISI